MDKKFTGNLGDYIIIPTQDQSITLRSCYFDENCHSTAGAYQETLYNYVDGCQIVTKAQKQKAINILEVGFGAGIGLQATIECLNQLPFPVALKFYSLELDPALISWAQQHCQYQTFHYPKPAQLQLCQRNGIEFYHAKLNQSEISIILGDALQTLPLFLNTLPLFDAIYQDPFSPVKNPTLWSENWFRLLRQCSHPQTILSTYSCASAVKKALQAAGWKIEEVAGFATKKSSLRATIC